MATQMNVNKEKSLFADKSPRTISPTDAESFLFCRLDASAIANDANLSTKLYDVSNGADVSSTMLTGSTTATGDDNQATSKTLAGNLVPNNQYVLTQYGTVDGLLQTVGKLVLNVLGEGVPQ